MSESGFAASVRRIAPLAWPVFVGQVSVLAFSTIDTALVARHSATDLAALAVGAAAYITVFIGLMGVVMAVSPIVGQLHGARRLEEAGHQLHQAVWLAIALSLPGALLLSFPQPFLAMARAGPDMAPKVSGYLGVLAFSLPASLLFTTFRGFNTAVSRPKAVMALQLGGLAVKLPLSWLLVTGAPGLGLPAMGVLGCGLSTLAAMWTQALLAYAVLRRDPFYRPFALHGLKLRPPHGPSLAALLRLGVPIGLSILIEVTGFAFMAVFIARLGTTAVAGHQIAANLVSLMFMLPLALSNATGTLVAQAIGAGRLAEARRTGWHGMALALALAATVGSGVMLARDAVLSMYTGNAAIVAAAAPLLVWLVLFHIGDAAQVMAVFVLRAWRIATVPVVIYAVALWGVGLGGGSWLAGGGDGTAAAAPWRGAPGFWMASTTGLALAGLALTLFMAWVTQRPAGARDAPAQP